MKQTTRRGFLKGSTAAGLALGSLPLALRGPSVCRAQGANSEIRVGVVGMGSTTAIGGVGGRGHQLIPRIQEVPGVKIVALCDADQAHLDREAQEFSKRGEKVATYRDMRRLFDDKNIDAVVVALPNHWHALATVWACLAGKDVYVEKPFAYNLWEGRQMVAAARKHDRIVQVGTQNRSSKLLKQVFESLPGELGPVRFAHALVYRARDGIGTVTGPTPVPETLDYDQWCGPAPKGPLQRKQLHYEWHWFWDTGNGEMGNNGIHVIDICRWALKQDQIPPRAISVGGRYGFQDCGETANTQIAYFDYQPAPLICEVRNLSVAKDADPLCKYRNRGAGILLDCEGGYFAGDSSGGALFDGSGKQIKKIPHDISPTELETVHLANFFSAVRSRRSADLAAEALVGHRSAACCHLANTSYRLGKTTPPDAIHSAVQGNKELVDAFDRCREYLLKNGVDLGATPAALGPWLTYDASKEQFVEDFADAANALSRREYRAPYVVPEIV